MMYDLLAIVTTTPAACSFSVASRHGCNSTGKERDSETGLDYFGARFYGSIKAYVLFYITGTMPR